MYFFFPCFSVQNAIDHCQVIFKSSCRYGKIITFIFIFIFYIFILQPGSCTEAVRYGACALIVPIPNQVSLWNQLILINYILCSIQLFSDVSVFRLLGPLFQTLIKHGGFTSQFALSMHILCFYLCVSFYSMLQCYLWFSNDHAALEHN